MNFTIEGIEEYGASPRFRDALKIPKAAPLSFSLLGQGEYNINYLFVHPVSGQKLVLRQNTKSQMQLKDQIGYEYHALQLLSGCGRTPKPCCVDRENRILVMEFLPGRPLDYRTDLPIAAACLAQIHAVEVPQDCRLLAPKEPLRAMLEECQEMARVYLQFDRAKSSTKNLLCCLLERAEQLPQPSETMTRCIINTELNSGNFLINGPHRDNYLVDWEKPLIGEAAQDLGHFLAPTTTLWKTEVLLCAEEKEAFLQSYLASCEKPTSMEMLRSRTAEYETMTCLRGVTWCAMAWVEYQDPNRPIQNEAAYRKIEQYLTDDFLNWILNSYFA